MAEAFLTFVRKFSDLEEGRRAMYLKDLTPGPRKYDTRHVRAEVRRGLPGEPGFARLYVRSETGVLQEEPWSVRILEELPDLTPGEPWTDVFAAEQRG